MSLPAKGEWKDILHNPYHLFVFDPGGTIGWAHAVIDPAGFASPEVKILPYLAHWDCGEFTGTEREQIKSAVQMIRATNMYKHHRLDVVAEDFELTQLIGGKNLLSPVRINAVVEWELANIHIQLQYQRRAMRTAVTGPRLVQYGFQGKWSKTGKGKDAFAAMQHMVVWLRRVKQQSKSQPWVIGA